MRYRDQNGQDRADIIDFLTTWPPSHQPAGGDGRPSGRLDAYEFSGSDGRMIGMGSDWNQRVERRTWDEPPPLPESEGD
jgi:hypothetical protein